MTEFNFWDDRTWDDSYFCPILNDYCYQYESEEKCQEKCQKYKDFVDYYNNKEN